MYSFHPGPSQVYPSMRQYLADAFDAGILSLPHRDPAFSEMYRKVHQLMKEKLNLPDDYSLYFFSSATECWSVVAEGMVQDSALHIFTGDFGRRWYDYSYTINQRVARMDLEVDSDLDEIPLDQVQNYEMVCLTHNETSNGTQITASFLSALRQWLPNSILAVDATSSLGGVDLKLEDADVWFASSQKCLGLPAGLAVMLCSPRAVNVFKKLGFDDQYNSLIFSHKNYLKYQTTHTPNVLNTYLLMRVLETVKPVSEIHKELKQRASAIYEAFDSHPSLRPLVAHKPNRSSTVICIEGLPEQISASQEELHAAGIRLGNGYGSWAERSFRIANFPAHTAEAFEQLQQHFFQTTDTPVEMS